MTVFGHEQSVCQSDNLTANAMLPSELKKPITTSLHRLLSPWGYKKTGSIFSQLSNDVVQLIDVQGSRHNSSDMASFTVNVAVFVLPLIDEDMIGFTKPSVAGAHWSQRLGSLSPCKRDLWWSASTLDEAENAANEICSMVDLYALPVLGPLSRSEALVALWQTGNCPGITDYQRKDYLERLIGRDLRQ